MELAKFYNVTDAAISAIRQGKTWQHVGGPIGPRIKGQPYKKVTKWESRDD